MDEPTTKPDAGCVLPYLAAPVLLPGLGGGIDIFGGATGDGSEGWNPADAAAFDYTSSEEQPGAIVTATDVEALFCPNTAMIVTGLAGEGESAEAWENGSVGIFYDTATRQVTDLLVQTGYLGSLTATSADGTTQYVFELDGSPIHKIVSGVDTPLILDWSDSTALHAIGDELFDALRVTFAPSVPASQCVSGSCVFGMNGAEGGYIDFQPLGFTMFVATTAGTPTANSAPVLLDMTNAAASPNVPDGG